MDITKCDNYVLDVPNTIISNVPYLTFVILIGAFIIKGFYFISTLESENTQLLGFIVFLFSFVRLIDWLRLPELEYKPR